MESVINICIVEDEELVRENLAELFKREKWMNVVGSFATVQDFLENIRQQNLQPDIVILDINLPGGISGLQGIPYIRQRLKDADIVMFTNNDDSEKVFSSLQAGAVGYITKKSDINTILEAIRAVYQGGSFMSPTIARHVVEFFNRRGAARKHKLTPRQQQIVDLIVKAYSYKMIADELFISVETVRDHIKNIYRTLEVNSKAEVISKVMRGEI